MPTDISYTGGHFICHRYGLDDQGWSPGRGWEFFSSPTRRDWPWGSPSLLSNGYHGHFPWGKTVGA